MGRPGDDAPAAGGEDGPRSLSERPDGLDAELHRSVATANVVVQRARSAWLQAVVRERRAIVLHESAATLHDAHADSAERAGNPAVAEQERTRARRARERAVRARQRLRADRTAPPWGARVGTSAEAGADGEDPP